MTGFLIATSSFCVISIGFFFIAPAHIAQYGFYGFCASVVAMIVGWKIGVKP